MYQLSSRTYGLVVFDKIDETAISICTTNIGLLVCIINIFELLSHWSVIEHRTRKQNIEPDNYTTQNLENMADLHGEI